MNPFLATISNDQLNRLYYRAYWKMRKLFEGGDDYGVDWPTLYASYPSWHRTLKMIHEEFKRRTTI